MAGSSGGLFLPGFPTTTFHTFPLYPCHIHFPSIRATYISTLYVPHTFPLYTCHIHFPSIRTTYISPLSVPRTFPLYPCHVHFPSIRATYIFPLYVPRTFPLYTCYMPRPYHSPWFHHPNNNIWRGTGQQNLLCSLCNCLRRPVSSSFLGPHNFLSTFFPNTLSMTFDLCPCI